MKPPTRARFVFSAIVLAAVGAAQPTVPTPGQTSSAEVAMWRGWLVGVVTGDVEQALAAYSAMTDDATPVPEHVGVLARMHDLLLLRGRVDEARAVEQALAKLTGDSSLDWLSAPPESAAALRAALQAGDSAAIETQRRAVIQEMATPGPRSGSRPPMWQDLPEETTAEETPGSRVILPLDRPLSPMLRRRVAEIAAARLDPRSKRADLMEADLVHRLERQPDLRWLLAPPASLPTDATAQRRAADDALQALDRALHSPIDAREREVLTAFADQCRQALADDDVAHAAELVLVDLPYRLPEH